MTVLARAVVLTALLCFAVPSAALAAANDDTIVAAPSGVQDVLANDTEVARVTGSSDPAHGTAGCSALGACFYTADPGYTGPDSFTYTAELAAPVPGGPTTTTATVTVDVRPGTAAADPVARDDDAATLAGQAVVIDVLANDTGAAPLGVPASTAPQHGTASCTGAGSCTYTPAPGFAGSDGFRYTLRDGAGAERSGDVRITVAPAGTGLRLLGSGGPALVQPGGTASWSFGLEPLVEGTTDAELAALPLPRIAGEPDGPHTPADVRTARGWTAGTADGAPAATATADALLGDAISEPFPRPLPPISQGTGGDGHVPILVGSKVFALFHHQQPTQITCVDRATGQACPGYPKSLQVGTSDANGPGAVIGDRFWTHAWPSGSYAETAPIALFCWDASTASTCGMAIAERRATTVNPVASAPVLVDGKLWLGAVERLLCLDPATGEPCGEVATGIVDPGNAVMSDIITHGTLVYTSIGGGSFQQSTTGRVACIDLATRARCPGWDTPWATSDGRMNLVTYRSPQGEAIGVCAVRTGSAQCIRDGEAPASATTLNGWPSQPWSDRYDFTQEAEFGSRTLVGSLDEQGLACYDWATQAACTGGGWGAGGYVRTDSQGNALPQRGAYGATSDGACAVALGDNGIVYTVDPTTGASPCLSLRSGARSLTVDLRDQRCDRTVGNVAWRSIRVGDTTAAEFPSITVTVRDGETGQVVLTRTVAGGETIDLSSVAAADHPSLTIDATGTKDAGADPWSDAVPPRLVLRWKGDPAQLCLRTTGTRACSAQSPTPIGVTGRTTAAGVAPLRRSADLRRDACQGGVAPSTQTGPPLPTARTCLSVRRFEINIRYPSSRIRSIRVTALGRPQAVRFKGRRRPLATVDLRGSRRSTIKVEITIRTKDGRTLRGTRTYRTCREKLRGPGFRF